MARYIDADELLKHAHKATEVDEAGFIATFYTVDVEEIKKMPTANVQEVVRGEWIKNTEKPHTEYYCYSCSKCGVKWCFELDNPINEGFNFCPKCGADMIG